ncbi:amidohydrolase family protein [Mesorhizobium sp. LHD-90]|uniref:amidohydrolase family protein n=1 Tax=Mesorhizobium sp. LHD-90 TaxID=3071414 RepID=UPI0027E2075C|nr:amidohydrolase family protein [Mesorhizobium sp. LHD-90]MDQ6434047.1 amidohydrolase family protein [Mesorhizobium sp. LHD-90]
MRGSRHQHGISSSRRPIVDAHAHLYDSRAIRYGIFEDRNPTFEALVGDYDALPRVYGIDDYLRSTRSRAVSGLVWHEFIAEDTLGEIAWARRLAASTSLPMALVGVVDFADPGLPRQLEAYRNVPGLSAVRQHLGWDEKVPLRRMAARPDFMSDPDWLKGLGSLQGRDLHCGLEVFAPQLPELLGVVRAHPQIGFTIAVMGWPTDRGAEGFSRWRTDMLALGRCGNTCASISAVECIFGLDWSETEVDPWILTVIEAFGPQRCMFGSHLPIDGLSYGFDRLYDAYEHIVSSFSDDEKDAMFRGTAAAWFRIPQQKPDTIVGAVA